jgi:fluoroacetyl-CoA thioesterase
MPEVFATGFMVGLVEWACIDAIHPHLDFPAEQSVGTHVGPVAFGGDAARADGHRRGPLATVEGRKLTFEVSVHDGHDTICTGRHDRVVIDVERFTERLARKRP